jgi:hypothetical protein
MAFDQVEHHTIIKMLEAKGFPPRWIAWVKDILSTTTSAVLLNGGCRKEFKCKRGVKQGDPLSPYYLFLQQTFCKVLSTNPIMMVLY